MIVENNKETLSFPILVFDLYGMLYDLFVLLEIS